MCFCATPSDTKTSTKENSSIRTFQDGSDGTSLDEILYELSRDITFSFWPDKREIVDMHSKETDRDMT